MQREQQDHSNNTGTANVVDLLTYTLCYPKALSFDLILHILSHLTRSYNWRGVIEADVWITRKQRASAQFSIIDIYTYLKSWHNLGDQLLSAVGSMARHSIAGVSSRAPALKAYDALPVLRASGETANCTCRRHRYPASLACFRRQQ